MKERAKAIEGNISPVDRVDSKQRKRIGTLGGKG
jgi:hypothetical protein